MTTTKKKKMRHISFVLPPEQQATFRFICYCFDTTPSEMLRKMVAEKLEAWDDERITKEIKERLGDK